ncbi:MAG: FAD-dependent oxidoreductase [Clostridia bacterium]|nr:FAD-dependent oxidoreductase [Clostridia bacterium]
MSTVKRFEAKKIDDKFDLIVVGGGLSGTMAAIAAAREGAKVLLVEKYGFLGGMITSGLVTPFMTYYEKGSRKLANAGLFLNMLERVNALSGSTEPHKGSVLEEYLKIVLDRMTKEYGVKVLFHSQLCGVDVENGTINSITVATVSGNIKLYAKTFIDATGNADLSAFAGMQYKQGRDQDGLCQPMTLCFRLTHVDWDRYDWNLMQKLYKEKQIEGVITNPREDVLIFRYPINDIMHFNSTRIVGKNPVDIEDYSEAEMIAREQMLELFRLVKDNVPGFEDSQIVISAPELGIRESRRVVGHYEITADDILGTTKFEDAIARGTYEIDIHNPSGNGTDLRYIPENDYYTIPYRALVPLESNNLLVAGRPISSTHEAHSAFRIMPICTCMGEAAGVAAALAVKKNCNMIDVPTDELRNILIENGALV